MCVVCFVWLCVGVWYVLFIWVCVAMVCVLVCGVCEYEVYLRGCVVALCVMCAVCGFRFVLLCCVYCVCGFMGVYVWYVSVRLACGLCGRVNESVVLVWVVDVCMGVCFWCSCRLLWDLDFVCDGCVSVCLVVCVACEYLCGCV